MSNEKQKIKIGITGGIGSGKTFVSSIFRKLNIPVFNADFEAKKCMSVDARLKNKIENVFGREVYKKGVLQNKVLAEIVFANSENLEGLNRLVHPEVKKKFHNWCADQSSDVVIKEAAILFESYSHIGLDKVICVSAPYETRIERVIKRDNISKKQVMDRMKMQMSQVEKEKLSDFVIINNGVELLLPQIIKIITQIN